MYTMDVVDGCEATSAAAQQQVRLIVGCRVYIMNR